MTTAVRGEEDRGRRYDILGTAHSEAVEQQASTR